MLRLIAAILCVSSVAMAQPQKVCHKCEILREYHAKHPSKYKYYEDYLKDLEENGGKLPVDPDFPLPLDDYEIEE